MTPNHDIIMNANTATISRRQKIAGPNHHLCNNHGHWWFHATFHLVNGTAQRVRFSLKTCDLETARARRDKILSQSQDNQTSIAA